MKDAFADAWAKVHVAREDREAASQSSVKNSVRPGLCGFLTDLKYSILLD
jgi:hypothetical protein